MAGFAFEPVVAVVNRVRDRDGKTVPWTVYYGGETMTLTDRINVPIAVARVIIHHSMYRLEPDTFHAYYRLGCSELNLPTDPISEEEVARAELIEREMLGPDRQIGSLDRFGRKLQPVRRQYHAVRRDPLAVPNPGQESGAFGGTYGEPSKPE